MGDFGSIFLAIFISIFYLAVPISRVYAYKVGNVDVYITGNVSETFDDNITEAKGDKKDDFITNAVVGIRATYEGKTTTFELTADVAQHFFAHYDNFKNTSVDFLANLTQDISEYDRIFVTEAFMSAQDPFDLAAEFGKIPGRYDYVRNNFSLEYSHDFTSQFSMHTRYANEAYIPSISELSDSYLNQLGIGGKYSLSSATDLLFGYDYYYRNFYPGENALINVLSAGLKQYFTKQFYLEGKTGIQFIHSFNDNNSTKPLINVSLVNDISKNTRWSLTCKKEYSTDSYTEDIFNYWEVFPQITQQLSEKTGLTFSGFYGEGQYRNLGTDLTLKGLNLGLEYSIKANIKSTFSYAYTQTDSDDLGREYSRNRYDVGMKIKF